tara:strand:- start:1991 stop:2191 length:201 start_codon:yes stop_codon:yes gene_type:complete
MNKYQTTIEKKFALDDALYVPTKEERVAFGMVASWATTLIYQNRVNEDQTTIDLVEAFLNQEDDTI